GGREFVQAIFFDQFFNRGGVDHDFQRGRHAAADGADHALTDDGLHAARQLTANLFAFLGLERIQDAIDGLRGVRGVERGQNQMPRVRRADGCAETDRVAHFANHDDVRVLPQNVLERVMKGEGVQADFALLDHGLIVFENIFDRIFKGDEMFFEIGVDVFDHRRERGGFAGTGGTRDEYDAAR